jgi:hypothetical protein
VNTPSGGHAVIGFYLAKELAAMGHQVRASIELHFPTPLNLRDTCWVQLLHSHVW